MRSSTILMIREFVELDNNVAANERLKQWAAKRDFDWQEKVIKKEEEFANKKVKPEAYKEDEKPSKKDLSWYISLETRHLHGDYKEKFTPAENDFIQSLQKLKGSFLDFHIEMEKIKLKDDDITQQKRVDAHSKLERSINEFAQIRENFNYVEDLSETFQIMFEETVASEKRYIQVRLNTDTTIQNDVHKNLIDRLNDLHQKITAIFIEIKNRKLTVSEILESAEAKQQLANKNKTVTKVVFENQLAELPDTYYKFYLKLIERKTFAEEHKDIANLQERLRKFAETYDSLNFSYPTDRNLVWSMRRALAAELVFMRNLITHGSFNNDVVMLLDATREQFSKIVNRIFTDRELSLEEFIRHSTFELEVRSVYSWYDVTLSSLLAKRAEVMKQNKVEVIAEENQNDSNEVVSRGSYRSL